MDDWKKTQYRQGVTPDPLAESEDFKYGVGGWLLGLVLLVCVVGLVAALLF